MISKNTFDDIIPPPVPATKRSIRNIPIREKKQNKIDELLEETAGMRTEHHIPPPVYIPPSSSSSKSGRRPRKGKWFIILILAVAAGVGTLFFFRGASVDIVLKTETIPVDLTTTSTVEASASSTLSYKVLPIQKEGSKEVAATGPAVKVEKKASGTIIIYNNYSAEAQQLIATTRFETSEGLVYRIDKAVTIPGNGSAEAVVTADQPGEKYNAEKKDFTIPGFKGTPKYSKFYARSKTALSGGFVGTMPKIADADLKAVNDSLEQELITQALATIQSEKPTDYAFFKEGVRSTYTSSVIPSADGKAVVTGKLILEALIFEKSAIEKVIADTKDGQRYRYDNLEDLALSILNQKAIASFISGPALSLRLEGTLTTGQSFDPETLKRALAGKAKGQLPEILKMYPEISRAEATLRPFWSSSFPENHEKITINVTK